MLISGQYIYPTIYAHVHGGVINSGRNNALYIRWVGVAGTSKTRFHRVCSLVRIGTLLYGNRPQITIPAKT